MKFIAGILIIAVLLISCFDSPSGPGPQETTDTQITLSTTPSSDIADIVKSPDKSVYENGDTVTLSVSVNAGYTFTGWSGDIVSKDEKLILVMNGPKTVYANFKNSSGKTIFSVVTSATNGSITLSPAGGVYDSGTIVFAYPRPDYGFKFSNWTGAINGKSELDSIIVRKSVLINANFSIDPQADFATLYIDPSPTNGKIVLDPPGVLSGNSYKYKPGTDVTVTAVPNSGFDFIEWDGDSLTALESDTSFAMTMNKDRTVTAVFRKQPEGVNWIKRTSGNGNGLCGVVWGKNQLVVVGNSGTILTSPDGTTWTSRTSGVTPCLNSVVWNGNIFLCVGDNGTILTSTDGITWTKQNSNTTYHLNTVIWTGTEFFACGGLMENSALNYNCLLTSPDGNTWTDRSSGSGIWYGMAWNGTTLVVSGYDFDFTTVSDYSESFVMFSRNSSTWEFCSTSIPREASFTSIIWTGTQFVAVGGSRYNDALSSAYTSKDGDVWIEGNIPTSNFMKAVTWTGNTLVAVGDGGAIYNSIDAVIWKKSNSGVTDPIFNVTWTGSRLVAVGFGGMILTSP